MTYNKLSSLIYDYTKPVFSSVDNDLHYYKINLIPKKGKMLELGCGNGRVLLTLLKYGLDVDGVEISEDMFNLCKANLIKHNLKTDMYLEDMRTFKVNKKYETFLFINGSINFVETKDLEQIFKNLYEMAEENAVIYMDLIFPNVVEGTEFTQEIMIEDETYYIFTKNIKTGPIVQNRIEYKSATETEIQDFQIYIHSTEDAIEAAKKYFEVLEIVVNFNFNRRNTPTDTIIFKKKST